MPTPSDNNGKTKEDSNVAPKNNESNKNSLPVNTDGAKSSENALKKKQNGARDESPRRNAKNNLTNRNGNHQNVNNRQNRTNSVNKRSTNDANNNSNSSSNKQPTYKVSHATQQNMLSEFQQQQYQKVSNGHVDSSKKNNHQKYRSITKVNQNGNYYENLQGTSTTTHSESPQHYLNDHISRPAGDLQHHSTDVNVTPRKYSLEFLHEVRCKMSNGTLLQQHKSPKSQKQIDDTNLLALKMALGDNSGNYNHFYASSIYGNQMLMQYQQYQQQNFTRLQQQQQHQQMQRMYQRNQHDHGYQRGYHPSMYTPEQDICLCTKPQQQQQPQIQQALHRTFPPTFSHLPSYQNRNKREYRDQNKKNRNAYQNNERNFKSQRDYRNNIQIGKSHSFSEDDNKCKEVPVNRTISDQHPYRSLSPTPPSSSKSSSPGAHEKEERMPVEVNYELVDDTSSTGSAASSGPILYANELNVSDMKVSMSAPVLSTPVEEPSSNVNLWIDSNFGSILQNGLSMSAENLNNIRDPPVKIFKRPPSINGGSFKQLYTPIYRSLSYDVHSPFEYYLSRTENSTMNAPPLNLRCGSQWDQLSVDMWDKFKANQQSQVTYRNKMILWRDLFHYVKNFPPFHQRAVPKWGLFLVGSTISGFGADTSDIDMCLVSKGNSHMEPRLEAMITLNELQSFLTNSMSPFRNFFLINAKVPILRFRDASDQIEIDLNYNNCVGVRNTHLLNSYSQLDWRLRPLALVVKIWAQYHNINDARNSTISSYSLVLMVIHFLQYAVKPIILPCLHQLCPSKFQKDHDITTIDMVEICDVGWKSDNNQPLGELFLRFLDYYSNFDYGKNAISIRTGGVLPIDECRNARSHKNDPNHWQTLCIEEPFDLTNTARSAYDSEIFQKIKDVFFQSFYRLKETRSLSSVFGEKLFHHQQQQQISQMNMMKYMMANAHGTQIITPMNDVKS